MQICTRYQCKAHSNSASLPFFIVWRGGSAFCLSHVCSRQKHIFSPCTSDAKTSKAV